jgi:hypothetical protein
MDFQYILNLKQILSAKEVTNLKAGDIPACIARNLSFNRQAIGRQSKHSIKALNTSSSYLHSTSCLKLKNVANCLHS